MYAGTRRGRELELITELCRELAERGVNVGLSDARPALFVRVGLTHPRVWVTISACGGSFVWRRNDQAQHPVTDPAGAAQEIASYVRAQATRTDR